MTNTKNLQKNNIPVKKISFLFIVLLAANHSFAQDTTAKNFSLKEAIEFALANNSTVLNAQLDVNITALKKKEIRGMGLPQISGSFDVKNYVELPTQLLPGEVFGGPPGTFIPVKFGTKYNATGGIQASQLIFNSDYIVAIQSSKTATELSQKNYERTRIETITLVSKAYYSVLVNKERLKLVYANMERIKKLLDDTKILYANGFVEKIDVDRITVTHNNVLSEKEKVERLVAVTESLLKFQMGLDLNIRIVLTDSLQIDNIPSPDLMTSDKFDYKSRIEYSLLLSQQKLNEFDLKRNMLSYMPGILLYGNLSAQAQRNEFDILDTDKKWYPIGIVGANVTMPIFSGGQKQYRIQQSKLNLLKTMNTLNNLENAIDLDIQVAKTSYLNAITTLNIQKINTELAEGIFDAVKKKYEQGVGSNLEVLIAETSLKEAQTYYYNALYEYYIAKIDYDKANGTIK